MDSRLTVDIHPDQPHHAPGSTIEIHYELDSGGGSPVERVEIALVWETEGKGDDDRGTAELLQLDAATPPERRASSRRTRCAGRHEGQPA